MKSTSSIALSGMSLAQTQLATSAHNVANLSGENFRRKEVVASERADGGVSASVRTSPVAGDNLEADLVAQLEAKNAFAANLAVFKTANRMAGALVDEKV